MQTNILWRGREYYSLENCLVDTSNAGAEINSIIIGTYNEKIYRVEYLIKTNQNWETIFLEIKSRHSNQLQHMVFEGDGKGNWMTRGKPAEKFSGCIDIDITLTPFTNTLPINRIKPAPGTEHQVSVLYLDVLEQQVKAVQQKYICIAEREFQFENVPNDFEARIKVDESGFVVDYSSLFEQAAALRTNYR